MATTTDTVITNKYIVDNYVVGKFTYDTVFIKRDDIVIQIPCVKELKIAKGKEITIDSFDKPIEKLV